MSAHATLRAATRAAHDRVDAGFAKLNLGDRADYRIFLRRHAAAFLPAEEALTSAGADRIVAGWSSHRRGPALLADLAELGIEVPAFTLAPSYQGDARILGGTYVLEGSRLGGAILRRSVAPGLPRRFLDSVQPPGRWRAFLADLDLRLSDRNSLDLATQAALRTFALFDAEEMGRAA